MRNILGVDPGANAIGIAEYVHEGQTVQFHVLGPDTAALELRALLTRYRDRESRAPAGALLFSCNGRGMNLYGSPDHDTHLFHDVLGRDIPLGGFFCAGEIGPVGAQTYLHGMTSSFGIIRPAQTQTPPKPVARARKIPVSETRNG
jgi:small ligand-binding sensory domain FIST